MGKRWLPLESNPDVMNQFMWELGVPEYVGFCDVYGLDDEMLATVPQPVLALLLLYPQDWNKESQALAASSVETKEPSKNVYFTKQTIGNACGTVGIIHALGNTASRIKLAEGSYFDRFFKRTADMDPTQRAAFLEEDEEMENAHYVAVTAGDTEVKDGVIEHYVCFSCVDGELYELDGGKSQPIYHGPSSPDTFLQDAAKVIKARIAEYSHSNNFNVMALSSRMNANNSEQPVDEIPGFSGSAPMQDFHGGLNPRLHPYPYLCGFQQHPSTGFMPFPVQPSSPAAPAQNQTSPPAIEIAMCPGPAVMQESQGDGAGGSVTTDQQHKAVASRIKLSNFSPKEDVFLVKSWLEIRFGPILNRGLKGEGLWSRIMSRYNEKRGRYPERSIKSLQSRWELIKAEGAKFAVYVANVLRDNPSRMSDVDKTSLAQANFADIEQYPFAYMHCWDLLKDEPRWMEINHKRPRFSDDDGIRDHIPPTSNNIDLDPEIPIPNSSGAKRPMGRYAANAAANKSASSSAPASSSRYASKLQYPCFNGFQQHPSSGLMLVPVQPSTPAAPAQNQTSPPAVETEMCSGPEVMIESQGDGAGGLVPTGRRRKVVASRIKLSNFSQNEDVYLVNSWLEIRCGPILNRGLKRDGLWRRITSRYNEKRGRYPERSIRSLQSRWEHIKAEGAKFAVYMANVLRDNPCGMSDADKTSLAQANFADVEQYSFAFMHCWDLLKDEPKWLETSHKGPRQLGIDGIRDIIPHTSNTIDLDPEIPSPNSSGAQRPVGGDAASAAANKSASSSASASSSQHASKLQNPYFNGFQQHPSSGLVPLPVQASSPAAPAQNQTSPPAVETETSPEPAVMKESQGDGTGGSVPTGQPRKVVANRIKLSNFSPKEDVFLVKSWQEIKRGSIRNSRVKREGFWSRIRSRYNEKRDRYPERSVRSLQSRWEHIKAEGAKFAVYVANVLRDNPSGMSNADKISLAQANFADAEQYPFAYMHCWDLLKDEPKWIGIHHEVPRDIDDDGIRDHIFPTSNTVDLDPEIPSPNSSGAKRIDPEIPSPKSSGSKRIDPEIHSPNSSGANRPTGRNEAADKSASSSASASSSKLQDLSVQDISIWQEENMKRGSRTEHMPTIDEKQYEELRKYNESMYKLEQQKMRFEQEKLQLMREKLEMQRRKEEKLEEERILGIDLDSCPPPLRVYYQAKQEEILRKIEAERCKNSGQ